MHVAQIEPAAHEGLQGQGQQERQRQIREMLQRGIDLNTLHREGNQRHRRLIVGFKVGVFSGQHKLHGDFSLDQAIMHVQIRCGLLPQEGIHDHWRENDGGERAGDQQPFDAQYLLARAS